MCLSFPSPWTSSWLTVIVVRSVAETGGVWWQTQLSLDYLMQEDYAGALASHAGDGTWAQGPHQVRNTLCCHVTFCRVQV